MNGFIVLYAGTPVRFFNFTFELVDEGKATRFAAAAEAVDAIWHTDHAPAHFRVLALENAETETGGVR